jgi:hypothetical protein
MIYKMIYSILINKGGKTHISNTHKSFHYKFTPLQVQNNSRIETIYINKKENQLHKIDNSNFFFLKTTRYITSLYSF